MKFGRACLCLTVACLLISQSGRAKDKEKPPTSEELAAISARGKLLAQYDQIAWHATDKLLEQHVAEGLVRGYIVEFKEKDWVIAFGRLTEDRTGLIVEFQATTSPDLSVKPQPPDSKQVVDHADLFREFLAMDTARSAFGKQSRPYNAAVLLAPGGQYFVYFYPGSTDADVILMGGDVRFLVSSDGKTILEKRELHASIREWSTKEPKDGGKLQAAYHTHVLSDVPEDTDVMYVLMRHPPVPEYVASKKYTYLISAEGDIQFLGETDKVLKK